jgi:hypothetical protein
MRLVAVRARLGSLLIVLAWTGVALGQGVGDSAYTPVGDDDSRTNRGTYIGPIEQPEIAWIYEHPASSGNPFVEQPPSIGEDGTIYIGVRGSDNASRGLNAINPDGTHEWTFATGNGMSGTPAIDDSGHAYINIGTRGGRKGLAKVDLTANREVWFLNTVDFAYYSSPVIAENGNVLFGAYDTRVRSVTPAGTVDWAYYNNRIPFCSPAVDDAGTIYFAGGSAGGWPDGGFATALNPDGSVKWTRPLPDSIYGARFGPNVLDNGNIVFRGLWGSLSTFDPRGNLLWEINLGGVNSDQTGALSLDGSILYVKSGSSDQAGLYAIDVTDGSTVWSHTYGGRTLLDAPMVGADGTIYTSGPDGSVMAFDPAGSVLWTVDIAPSIPNLTDPWSSWPIIGAPDTLYVIVTAWSGDGPLKLMVASLVGAGNEPPVAGAAPDSQTVILGEEACFDGSGSYDPDGEIVDYQWDFGDGSAGTGATVCSTYVNAGFFRVELTVTDDQGESASDTVTLTVQTPAEAGESLIEAVENLDLPWGTENALTSKLENAIKSLRKDRHEAARNQLQAFINAVEAQQGKRLSEAEADALCDLARRIIAAAPGRWPPRPGRW